MGNLKLNFIFTTLLLIVLSACSPSKPQSVAPEVVKTSSTVAVTLEPASPFTMEVVQDLNDGKQLHIHGRITSATNWPTDNIVVRLTGMRSGDVRSQNDYALSKLLQVPGVTEAPITLLRQQPIDFYLSTASTDLTDYQVELLWGNEAKGAQKSQAEEVPAGSVMLRALTIQKDTKGCQKPPCPASFRIAGQLFNGAKQTVTQVQLGVGFVWVASGANLDLSAQIPQDEELVDIKGLSLAVKQQRAFNLVIDRAVPEVPGGRYQPVVRVVTFN